MWHLSFWTSLLCLLLTVVHDASAAAAPTSLHSSLISSSSLSTLSPSENKSTPSNTESITSPGLLATRNTPIFGPQPKFSQRFIIELFTPESHQVHYAKVLKSKVNKYFLGSTLISREATQVSFGSPGYMLFHTLPNDFRFLNLNNDTASQLFWTIQITNKPGITGVKISTTNELFWTNSPARAQGWVVCPRKDGSHKVYFAAASLEMLGKTKCTQLRLRAIAVH
ncbi:hypothetical protein ACJ72_04739 [Emergomyces africanus]|uniref:Uncharacterized protein n=1 Tax=Emergomyces africanus TaxID=1955775 RepID=A0A1B7NVW7_9EURO|nr:hypothetical protein ACJ72_04739 [Emergomyces africanus]